MSVKQIYAQASSNEPSSTETNLVVLGGVNLCKELVDIHVRHVEGVVKNGLEVIATDVALLARVKQLQWPDMLLD